MSDDIVERLREQAEDMAEGVMMSAVRDRLEWEAADEIERLRSQLNNGINQHLDLMAETETLMAETETFRRKLEAIKQACLLLDLDGEAVDYDR